MTGARPETLPINRGVERIRQGSWEQTGLCVAWPVVGPRPAW